MLFTLREKRSVSDDPGPWLDRTGGLSQYPNLRLALFAARRYSNKKWLSDVFQEAVIGLLRSEKKFDLKFERAFSTYSMYWLRQAIYRMPGDWFPFHVPAYLEHVVRAFNRRRDPIPWDTPDADVAAMKRVSEQAVGHARRLARVRVESMEELVVRDMETENRALGPEYTREEWVERHEVVQDDAPRADERLEEHDAGGITRHALLLLSPREQQVIRWRFGFDGGDELTLEEIAMLMSVTRERVRQIESKAIRKLRFHLYSSERYVAPEEIRWPAGLPRVSAIQARCAHMLSDLSETVQTPGELAPELCDALVAFYFGNRVRRARFHLVELNLFAWDKIASVWRLRADRVPDVTMPGPNPRRLPERAVENLASHWLLGVRPITQEHLFRSYEEAEAEAENMRLVEEWQRMRQTEERRARLLRVLLPKIDEQISLRPNDGDPITTGIRRALMLERVELTAELANIAEARLGD